MSDTNEKSVPSRLSVLEELRRSRESGQIFRDLSSSVEPLYDYVLESECAKGKVVFPIDSDQEISDSVKSSKTKKSRKRTAPLSSPSKRKCVDIRKMMVGQKRAEKELEDLRDDDGDDGLFEEMLADVGVVAEAKDEDVEMCEEMVVVEDLPVRQEQIEDDHPISEAFEQLSVRESVVDSGEIGLEMFWLDMYEDPIHLPDVVYLFGKTNSESIVVRVEGVRRKVFLIPKTPFTAEDVIDEFRSKVAPKFKIGTSRIRRTDKKNCFYEAPVNLSCVEIELADRVQLKPSYFDSVSHVIGANCSLVENFLLGKSIKGPCWLRLSDACKSSNERSWCQREIDIHFDSIFRIDSTEKSCPPLKVLTLAIASIPNTQNSNKFEICALDGVLTQMNVCEPCNSPFANGQDPRISDRFTVIAKTQSINIPFDFRAQCLQQKLVHIISLPTERALLSFLLNKVQTLDPDVIIGHDISKNQLELVMNRISETKAPHWSKLGRLKRSVFPRNVFKSGITCGRLLVDVALSARELVTKSCRERRSFDLESLCEHLLNDHRTCVQGNPVQFKLCFGASENLITALLALGSDALACLNLAFKLNVLPLAYQISTICGNVMSRTLLGGRSERNEFLLLHAFDRAGFLLPEPVGQGREENRLGSDEDDLVEGSAAQNVRRIHESKHFVGGLVLEPKIGFYDTFILLLDFNSLYPSIIQEYNVCFSTQSWRLNEIDPLEIEICPTDSRGVLPLEIQKLVQSRKEVRRLMASCHPPQQQDLIDQYNIRQMALKLTANSMYGCLGYARSRFYSRALAALVTALGRETLEKTKRLVESLNVEVIYGDTDSIMVNSCCRDLKQVQLLGQKLKTEINRHYQQLEIDVDGVFKCLLLMKKKKYAGLMVDGLDERSGEMITSRHIKGLDIIRRDWCRLAKECGTAVLDEILSGKSQDDVVSSICEILTTLAQYIESDQIPAEKFLIDKQLTKRLNLYSDPKGLPHVQVALRIAKSGVSLVKPGDVVSYLICEDQTTTTNLPPTQRAYTLKELKDNSLKIDRLYYLSSQIQPVVCRLLEPFGGIDTSLVASWLGLPESLALKSAAGNQAKTNEAQDVEDQLDEDVEMARFEDCEPFLIECAQCGQCCKWKSPFVKTNDAKMVCVLIRGCEQCDWCPLRQSMAYVKNTLIDRLRQWIKMFYLGWLRCEDCGFRTRHIPVRTLNCRPQCPACNKSNLIADFSTIDCYTQLVYYQSIFDSEQFKRMEGNHLADLIEAEKEPGVKEALEELNSFVRKEVIDKCAFGYVDLGDLFEGL